VKEDEEVVLRERGERKRHGRDGRGRNEDLG